MSEMELVVLFGTLALFVFGPRRGGRMPTRIAMIWGAGMVVWLLAAHGLGAGFQTTQPGGPHGWMALWWLLVACGMIGGLA